MDKTNTRFSTRLIAMLLTLVTFVSVIPLSMIEVFADEIAELAEDAGAENTGDTLEDPIVEVPGSGEELDDYPIMTLANPGGAGNFSSSDMLDNGYLDALEYTGYKVSTQRTDGTLFVTGYYAGSLKSKINNGTYTNVLSGIGYGTGNEGGLAMVSNSSTVTGKAPNISKFKSGGLECGSYVSYVLLLSVFMITVSM